MIELYKITGKREGIEEIALGRSINQSYPISVKGGKFKDQRLLSILFLLLLLLVSPRLRYSRLANLAARALTIPFTLEKEFQARVLNITLMSVVIMKLN